MWFGKKVIQNILHKDISGKNVIHDRSKMRVKYSKVVACPDCKYWKKDDDNGYCKNYKKGCVNDIPNVY